MRPIFILDTTMRASLDGAPKDIEVVEWTSICHGQKGKDFIFISHDPGRSPSRWTFLERKRPFIVYTRNWHHLGASRTLAGALKIAKREA